MTYLRAYLAFAHQNPMPCIFVSGLVLYIIIACVHGWITEDRRKF